MFEPQTSKPNQTRDIYSKFIVNDDDLRKQIVDVSKMTPGLIDLISKAVEQGFSLNRDSYKTASYYIKKGDLLCAVFSGSFGSLDPNQMSHALKTSLEDPKKLQRDVLSFAMNNQELAKELMRRIDGDGLNADVVQDAIKAGFKLRYDKDSSGKNEVLSLSDKKSIIFKTLEGTNGQLLTSNDTFSKLGEALSLELYK